jgi:uncharacterized membrane protein YgcG
MGDPKRLGKQIVGCVLSLLLLFATWPRSLSGQEGQSGVSSAAAPPYAQQTPEELQRLVAPIALYPDSLVAQILVASTFPEQVVEADRFAQANPNLKGEALAKSVDQQPWDPSVKALTAFPSVLGNMDRNLSWTSSLGDAYYNQQQDVMDAIQVMRQQAEQAGNLKTAPQQVVTTQGSTIIIEPANPDIVYIPAYDPWLIYGYSILPWPGWYEYPGIWFGGPYLSFGIGFGIGFFGGFAWGWPHWGFDWHHHYPVFDHNRYFSRSTTFYNRSSFYGRGGGLGTANIGRGEVRPPSGTGGRPPTGATGRAPTGTAARPSTGNVGGHAGIFNAPGVTARPFNGSTQAARGYAAPRGQSGMNSGAFNGYGRGGETRSYSSRGSSSFGGGGARGGGAARGGGRR